ncbi:MAG: hypothetical protein K6E22_03060 [Treponema sp.]|nr:hypothetical protein [Treponema sp.]
MTRNKDGRTGHSKPLFLLVFALFYLLTCPNLYANASDFHFSVEADVTLRLAEQGEYVFLNVDSAGRRTLSYLEWEQKPLFMPRAKVSAGWKNLYISASARTAIPARCGSVFDSDWMNVSEFPNCPDEYASIKTNFTESDCKTNYYYEFSGELSYMFKVADSLSFSPFAELSYVHSSFSAIGADGSYYNKNQHESNGYYGYYNDADSSYDIEMSGDEVLSLERIVIQAWLGGRFNMGITTKLDMGFSLAMNLWTFAQSLDSHLVTGVYYLDEFEDNFGGIKAGVDFAYKLSKKDKLVFAAECTAIQTLEGTSKSANHENASYDEYFDCSYWYNGRYYKCTSGFDFSSIEFTLGYRHVFN